MKYTEEEKEAIDEAKTIVSIKYGSIMHIEIRNMEKILNLLEKQQKEINKLNNENKKIKYFSNNLFIDDYISKEAIREKIKELSEEDRTYTDELSEPDSNFKIIDKNLKRIKNQTDILKELLGG